jgi:hypothetical protein
VLFRRHRLTAGDLPERTLAAANDVYRFPDATELLLAVDERYQNPVATDCGRDDDKAARRAVDRILR